jgi:excisionase family DNA binding protein
MEKTDRLLLRVVEVAELIGVGKSMAYQLVAQGSIPSVRLGKGSVRVPSDGLRRWIKELQGGNVTDHATRQAKGGPACESDPA